MTSQVTERVFGLDLLRAFAILFLVYTHGYGLVASHIAPERYFAVALEGVVLFFVLSGFLIGRILLTIAIKDEFSSRKLAHFWVRRWFRTLPNYFLVLAIVALGFYLLHGNVEDGLLSYVFFVQNIAWAHPGFFGEAWSLSVEEWFYLGIPLLMYLASRFRWGDRRRMLLMLIVLIIVLVTLFRIYRVQRFGYSTASEWDSELRKQVVTRLDSLMFGVLGAYMSLFHPQRWSRRPALLLGGGGALLLIDKVFGEFYPSMFYWNYITLSLTPIAVLLMLPLLSQWRREPGLLTRIVTFLSLVSYSMYLLNLAPVQGLVLPIMWKMCVTCGESPLVRYISYWAITVLASWLLYRYFEQPTTALRDKFQNLGTPRDNIASPSIDNSSRPI